MRTRLTAIFLSALLGVGVLSAPISASAAELATVTVQLSTPSGAKLEVANVFVRVSNAVPGSTFINSGLTNASGRVNLVVPGDVLTRVLTFPSLKYLPSEEVIVWAPAGAKVMAKVVLAKAATVSGAVKNKAGRAIPNAIVRAVNADGVTAGESTTSARGKYKIKGLPSGTYRIQFNSRSAGVGVTSPTKQYVWSYWKGSHWDSADLLKVKQQTAKSAASAKTGINGVLRKGQKLFVYTENLMILNTHVIGRNPAETFVTSLTDTRLAKGTYQIQISVPNGESVGQVFYMGDNITPGFDQNAAVPIVFTGTEPLSIYFGYLNPPVW